MHHASTTWHAKVIQLHLALQTILCCISDMSVSTCYLRRAHKRTPLQQSKLCAADGFRNVKLKWSVLICKNEAKMRCICKQEQGTPQIMSV